MFKFLLSVILDLHFIFHMEMDALRYSANMVLGQSTDTLKGVMSLFSYGMTSRSELLHGMVSLHSHEQVVTKEVQRAMFTTMKQAPY